MCKNVLPSELKDLGERLKIEFDIDQQGLTPAIEDSLFRLYCEEQKQAPQTEQGN